MANIFAKKHPEEKGYAWLTKPYIQKEVKNLGIDEIMEALFSYTEEATKLKGEIKKLEKTGASVEEVSKIRSEKIGEWTGGFMEKEVLPTVYKKLGGAVSGEAKMEPGVFEERVKALSEELVRRKLWEQKYSDAIVGQLYKLHTGQTVESISRLVRMSELQTGFGKGLAKTGQRVYEPSKEFLGAWPKKSAALGGRPVQEFATRMNEIMRFVIQKGMDEKHAGVEAVGAGILKNVAKKGGARTIMRIMREEEDQFGDLWDFNEQITKEAQLRLGALPTTELKGELKRFQVGRMTYDDLKKEFESLGGEVSGDVPREILVDALVEAAKKADISKDRSQIVNEIIKYIDLEAVFEELFGMIKRTAVKGLIKELQIEVAELPPEKRVRREAEIARAGGYESFAKRAVESEAVSDVGISILRYVTSNLQPLYRMRTRMETPAMAAGRTRERIEAPSMVLPSVGGEKLRKTYEDVMKTARVLSRSMAGTIGTAGGGVHSLMVLSALEKRYRDLEKITEVAKRAEIPEGYGKELVTKEFPYLLGSAVEEVPKLASDVWNESWKESGDDIINSIDTWANKLKKVKDTASGKIEELSQIMSVPPLATEEEYEAYSEFLSKYPEALKKISNKIETMVRQTAKVPEEKMDEVVDSFTDQAQAFLRFQVGMSEQLKRVSESMRATPFQKLSLEMAFPKYEAAVGKGPVDLANEINRREKESFEDLKQRKLEEHKDYQERIEEFWQKQSMARSSGIKETVETYKKPEIAAEDIKRVITEALDEVSKVAQDSFEDEIIRKKILALRALEEKAAGGPKAKEEVPLYKLYRGSGLYGGGGYGGVPQEEAILKQMLGKEEKSMLLETTGFRGSAIHTAKQKEFIKKYSEYGNVQIEGLIEDLDNMITGHYDVLFKTATGEKRIVDIKTIYDPKKFAAIERIAKEMQEKKITLGEYLERIGVQDAELARRLESYLSQVNFYLSGNIDALGGILAVSMEDPTKEVKLELGKFDPARFKKDVEVVKRARAKVEGMISSITDKVKKREFVETLPKTVGLETLRQIAKSPEQLVRGEEELFDKWSKEYLAAYKAMSEGRREKMWAATGAAGAGGGGIGGIGGRVPPTGGDGEDEFEKLRKKVEQLLSRGTRLSIEEAMKLADAVYEANRAYMDSLIDGNEKLANKYIKLKGLMDAAFETTYGEKGIKEVEKIRGVFKMEEAGGPAKGIGGIPPGIEIPKKEPFATTAYLKAMLRKATQFHDLFGGKDVEKFGEEIESLLSETLKEGPSFDVASKMSDAIKRLSPEKRGYIAKIWRYYKKSVSEYFIGQLDELEQSIKSAKTDEAERKAYDQYERTLQSFIGNIKRTLGKMSDIYTRGGFGEMKEWVSPELAKGSGLYRRPEELAETARQTSAMSGEFRPIFDVLIGDLDPMLLENMLTPLEKIRTAFTMLAKEDKGLKSILEDADLFRRIGDQAVEAWDFDRMIRGVTQLRAGLEEWNRMQISGFGAVGGAEDYTEAQRKNIQDTVKYLKQLEGMIGPVGGPAGSRWGMTQVPGFLDPKEQELLHKRNIALVREQFKLGEKAGGPIKGQRFTYRQRIVDPASKQVLKDTAEEFKKLGDAATTSGDRVGIFTQRTEDMIGAFQARKGVGQVFRRVIFWGGASTIVWGLIQALKNVVSTISDVEFGIARLRQVMSPLETDFEHITKAALEFAKQFGQPIQSVIDSMRVFAQQGLAQEEVIERARTSQLAANVSTLSASDATEALTAAMKVYGKEGASTLRFLDSWSQVEARHAITSADLANSMKKAAAVAKTSGVTFDELNAIVTGIGETSRQTGKEIGTSLRFMFRRIQASKGPKALGEIGVPVIGEEGDLRKGFDILGDLAGKWDELTNSQKLSIAQAIGGRRHYNSLIILMDHWGDALDTLEDSINSKGAAERRNAIVMETYAKRLQQVKSAAVELQVQFGKLALPIAKVLLTGFKGLLETISNIPNSVKTVALAVAGLFALFSKGQGFITRFSDSFRLLPEIMRDLASAVSKELKIGLFEVFGKLPGKLEIDTRGLKTIMEATNMGDLESILGKVGYKAAEFGRSWNSMLSEISVGGATALEAVSKLFGRFGTLLELGGTALAATGSPITQAFGGVLRVAEKGAEGAEAVSIKVAKAMGIPAEKLAEWTKGNTSFVKSVTPMIASLAALTPVAIKTWGSMKRLASSADEYEKAMAGARRKTSGELQALKDLSSGYRKLESTIEDLNKVRKPEAKRKALEREEYESPVFGMGELYKKTQKFGNELAKSNFTLIESFDEFGNVVLKTNRSLKDHIDLLTSAKREEIGKKESDILSKYVEDLTGGKGFTETFKYELKRFVKEIPAIGGLIAKHIAISPSKELDVLRDKMNKILSLREKYPMSTAVEPLFQKYYKQLEDARSKFGSTYKSFRRVLADVSTKGLEPLEIRDLLDTKELRKGFELMVRIEPKLQIKEVRGKVDWKDILGTEILKRIYPEKPLDFAAPLTKELLLQSKMLKRTGKAFAGDIVLFTEDVNNTIELFGRGVGKGFDVAGRQGILKFKEGVGYFVEYVTKEMRKVKEVPFSDVEKFVDAIFPTVTIQERLQDNLAVLEEVVAGAAAGMTGITEREFKKSFSLGERFFPQIPTTTLLQTTKGWAPGAGYGEMPYKGAEIPRTYETPFADLTKRWDEWMQTFWFEPMEQLKMIADPAEKRAMAGGGPGYGMAEDIQRLLDVLKNNQIVIQYRALHEDLMKTLNEGSRTLKENIAAEKVRNEYLVQTSGILKGMPEDLSDINLGVKKFSELTAQQRVLLGERSKPSEERGFTTARDAYREARIKRESLVGQVESIERARVQLREIRSTAVGLGAALSPEEAQRMVESVAIAGNKPLGLILDQEKQVVSNTGRMAETMDDLLAHMGDPEASARRTFRQFEHIRKQTEVVKADITKGSVKGIGERFNYLVKLRGIYEEVGRKDLIKAIDASLNELSSTLTEKIGMKKALKVFEKQQLVDRLYTTNATKDIINAATGQAATPLKGTEKLLMRLPGELTKKEFIQKAIGDLGLREFTQVLEKYAGKTDKNSEYFKTSVEMIRKFGQMVPTIGSLAKHVPIPSTERERVLGSKEFKGLEKEMSSQTVVSVTTSKNIQKMFAAYSGFQDIFRRAANREARYFEIQISELRGQRKNTVDQLKAGTISKEEAKKSTVDIDKKIAEMSAKREEAVGLWLRGMHGVL
jgi:TP901 family phage tail tape measure protein